jgi:hypothetical protein
MINFLKALETVDFVPPIVEKLYRLYYDSNGRPLFYSTEDLDGNFVTVSKEEHTIGRYNVTIINNKIVYPLEYIYQKLTPSINGTECTNNDVSVIGKGQHWSLTRYE